MPCVFFGYACRPKELPRRTRTASTARRACGMRVLQHHPLGTRSDASRCPRPQMVVSTVDVEARGLSYSGRGRPQEGRRTGRNTISRCMQAKAGEASTTFCLVDWTDRQTKLAHGPHPMQCGRLSCVWTLVPAIQGTNMVLATVSRRRGRGMTKVAVAKGSWRESLRTDGPMVDWLAATIGTNKLRMRTRWDVMAIAADRSPQ